MIRVTRHACERFVERVAPCSFAEAKASILSHSKALETAVAFGAEVVKLGTGHRLILQGATVVSVYPAHEWPRQCRNPYKDGGEA